MVINKFKTIAAQNGLELWWDVCLKLWTLTSPTDPLFVTQYFPSQQLDTISTEQFLEFIKHV